MTYYTIGNILLKKLFLRQVLTRIKGHAKREPVDSVWLHARSIFTSKINNAFFFIHLIVDKESPLIKMWLGINHIEQAGSLARLPTQQFILKSFTPSV